MSRHSIIPRIEQRRRALHTPRHLGERTADAVTRFSGSWLFVGLHVLWFALWIGLHIEPFPFGLLTMIVSLEAIYLSTFVLMSQNRQWTRDHARDEVEAVEVTHTYTLLQHAADTTVLIHELLLQNTHLTEQVHDLTSKIDAHIAGRPPH